MTLNRIFAAIFVGIFIVLIGLIALVRFTSMRTPEQLPEATFSCLPSETQLVKLWGLHETQGDRYYLIGASWRGPSGGETYQEVLIYLDSQERCRSLLPEDDLVLSHYIPLHLARDLALQRYTRVLNEQGGRDEYQRKLTDYLGTAPEGVRSAYPPEYVWALEQLDIELPPERYEVLR